MRYALRFVWVTFLSALLLSCAARIFIPSFDRARDTLPEDAAEDILDGICLWVSILLIPTIDLVHNLRKQHVPPAADNSWPTRGRRAAARGAREIVGA